MAKKERRTLKQLNLLDCTPIRDPNITFDEDKNGIITLHCKHDSFFDRFIEKVTRRKSTYTHITLEEFGTFIWKSMDGRTTLGEIAELLQEEFGDKVEPLYPRLNEYVMSLKSNKLIFWELPKREGR